MLVWLCYHNWYCLLLEGAMLLAETLLLLFCSMPVTSRRGLLKIQLQQQQLLLLLLAVGFPGTPICSVVLQNAFHCTW